MREYRARKKIYLQSTSDSPSVVHHEDDEILQVDDNLNKSLEFVRLPSQDIKATRKKKRQLSIPAKKVNNAAPVPLTSEMRNVMKNGDRFNSCPVIYSQFGLAIHQNDHQARRRFVEWAQNEIAVVPDFHKRILFSDEAHFWLNGNVNKQNCRIWSEANPQLYVETPLHPEKLTVWCALWAGGILLQKR
ncbi:hypothetical protein TNCV_741201 [Trichonephila clavipes]|nr:hypothetical protein TNCV_741201 [Trichonephila clavipes]